MGIFDVIIKGVGNQVLGGSESAQGGLMEHVLVLVNNPIPRTWGPDSEV